MKQKPRETGVSSRKSRHFCSLVGDGGVQVRDIAFLVAYHSQLSHRLSKVTVFPHLPRRYTVPRFFSISIRFSYGSVKLS